MCSSDLNLGRTRRYLSALVAGGGQASTGDGRRLAWVALALWTVATTAGRFMAYVG